MSRMTRAAFALGELRLIPLAFFVVLPVILVRAAALPVAPDATGLWPEYWAGDTRSWWKAVAAVGIALWMLVFVAARLIAGWRPRQRAFGGLALIAALCVLASTLLSPFRNTAWIGYTTLHEGALVLWAYLIAAWYAAEMTDRDGAALFLLRLLGVVCLVEACHGIAEGWGWHLWQTDVGRWLMGAGGQTVRYRFAESRMAYGTAFQPNHYGMMMAMLGLLALGMVSREGKRGWRIFWFAAYLAAAAAIVFSNSRAALLALAFLTVARLAAGVGCGGAAGDGTGGGRFAAAWRAGKPLLAVAVLAAVAFAVSPATRDAASRIVGRLGALDASINADAFAVKSVELKNDRLRIGLPDGTLVLEKSSRDGWTYGMEGGASAELLATDAGWQGAALPGAPDAGLRFRRAGNAVVTVGGIVIELYSVGTRIWVVDRESGALRPEASPSAFVPGAMDGFLNGRWYIWRRSLEARMGFAEHEDKGHGVWATSLAQLGIVGTAACGLCAAYVLLVLLRRGGAFGNPVFLALAGYGVCSFANDSTVGVTPIFCALLGLALSWGENACIAEPCRAGSVSRSCSRGAGR